MAEYLLSVHYIEGAVPPDPDTVQQMYADVAALNDEITAAGAWVFAGGLQEPHVASVVRQEDGQIVTTDGPFPEAKEQLGGVWVIDVPDHETAMTWARKATVACQGPVEVRPFQIES